MKKDKFEKTFDKLSKDTKACIVIRTDMNAEMPNVGCAGDVKEILWGLCFTTAQVLKKASKKKEYVEELLNHTCDLIKKFVEDEDED